MAKPTFFDRIRWDAMHGERMRVYGDPRPTFNPGHIKNGLGDVSLADMFRKAVPFVIDDDALATSMELRNGLLTSKKVALPDVARVPFSETWVEYDPITKVPDPSELTSLRVGHLIVRTEHGAAVLTWHLSREDGGKTYEMLPMTMNWTTEPKWDAPWRHIIGDHFQRRFTDQTADYVRAKLLTGRDWLPLWKNRIGGDLYQRDSHGIGDDEVHADAILFTAMHEMMFTECSAMLSLLMGILSLVAWCPTELIRGKPKGRWLHGGKTRPYMDVTTVKIKIPIRTAYLHVERAGREIKKRRHRVREHLRVYNRGKPNQKITTVHEHMRGDASLGFVNQDYEVTAHEHSRR